MYRVHQRELPFQGSSHQFVGADQGDVGVSVFLLSAQPGRGPGCIAIPMTKSSSCGRAGAAGSWMGLSSRPVPATSS